MNDAAQSIREGFVRQRRALLTVSLVVFFYYSAGIEVESINIFGSTLHVTRPFNVPAVLWVAWAYFLIRYYQYFRDLADKGFTSAYYGKLYVLARSVARNKFKQNFVPDKEHAGAEVDFTFGDIEVYSAYPSVWELQLTVDVIYKTHEGGVESNRMTTKMHLSWRDLLVPMVRSLIHVVLHTRLVTEYALPFLIALLPVLLLMGLWLDLV